MKRKGLAAILFSVAAMIIGPLVSVAPGDVATELALDPLEEMVQPRYFQRKAGICIQLDDADRTVYEVLKPLCEEISTEYGVTVKFTVGVMPNDQDEPPGTDLRKMTWGQIQDLSANYRGTYEVGLHGNADERHGPRISGYSEAWLDSMLTDHRAIFNQHDVPFPTVNMDTNHRHGYTMQDVYLKHGILWCTSLGTSVARDSTLQDVSGPIANEHTMMEINADPWPQAATASNEVWMNGFVMHGRLMDRYNIPRATWAGRSVAELVEMVDVAWQTQSMLVVSGHAVTRTQAEAAALGSYAIAQDSLRVVLERAATYASAGQMEFLTTSQVGARGIGYVWGNLMPHYQFSRVFDHFLTSDMPGYNIYPASFPSVGGAGLFVPSAVDTMRFGTATAADSTFWKVWDMYGVGGVGGLADTVLAVFTAEGIADSVSYGSSSPPSDERSRILIVAGASTAGGTSPALPIIVPVTGVRDGEIMVEVQALVHMGEAAETFIARRIGAFDENQQDFINATSAAYDFIFSASKTAAMAEAEFDWQRTRVRPQFSFASLDTVWANRYWTSPEFANGVNGVTLAEEEFVRMGNPLLPFSIFDDQGSVDQRATFGYYGDINTLGTGARTLTQKLDYFDGQFVDPSSAVDYGQAQWITYRWHEPIVPGVTDWVAGYIYLRAATTVSFSAEPRIMIADIRVWADK